MKQVFDDICALLRVEISKEEQCFVDQYWRSTMFLYYSANILLLLAFVYALLGIFVELPWSFGGFLIVIIYVLIAFVLKVKKAQEWNRIFSEKCDAKKALSIQVAMGKHCLKEKDWVRAFINIVNILIATGRFEECRKVLDMTESCYQDSNGKIGNLLNRACLAYNEKKTEELQVHLETLEELMKTVKDRNILAAYGRAMRYPATMQLIERGQYDALCALLSSGGTKETMLMQVSIQYRLYHAAKNAGMTEVAEKHKAFVLEHGGTTFYKKELE